MRQEVFKWTCDICDNVGCVPIQPEPKDKGNIAQPVPEGWHVHDTVALCDNCTQFLKDSLDQLIKPDTFLLDDEADKMAALVSGIAEQWLRAHLIPQG